jgi:hypothetical protein
MGNRHLFIVLIALIFSGGVFADNWGGTADGQKRTETYSNEGRNYQRKAPAAKPVVRSTNTTRPPAPPPTNINSNASNGGTDESTDATTVSAGTCDPSEGSWGLVGAGEYGCRCPGNGKVSVSESQCGQQVSQCSGSDRIVGSYGCECASGYTRISGKGDALECEKNASTASTTKGVTKELEDCIEPIAAAGKTCAESAGKAKKRCDQTDKSNKEVSGMMDIPSQLGNKYVEANAGKGMVAECIKAGVVGNGSKLAMQSMQDGCNAEVTTCTTECKLEVKEPEFLKCAEKIKYTEIDRMADAEVNGSSGNKDKQYYYEKLEELRANIAEGAKVCKEDAAPKKTGLDNLMNSFLDVVKAGMTCACQVAATQSGQSAEGCNNLPTPEECAANPSIVGCAAAVSLDICTMGSSSYSALGCKCQNDSSAAGCAGFVAQNAGNSGFAGADVKIPTGGAAFSPTAGGGLGGSGSDNIDLSGQKVDELSQVPKGGAVAGPGFLGGGGGAGGGASAPGGGGGGEPGAGGGEGEHSSSLGGIFGQAKSFVGNMFGAGKSGGAQGLNPKKGATGLKYDLDKFRPKGLRGVAGGTGMGSKNMDIWVMMRERYDINDNTFLQSP